MVVSTITSGLGNQLFQYALSREMALKQQSALYFDLRFYKSAYSRETNRSFKLNKFNIDFAEIDKRTEWKIRATKLFPSQTFSPFFRTIKEKHYHFDPEVLEASENFLNIKGYWHSEKYFIAAEQLIRRELEFSNVPGPNFGGYKNEIVNSENAVSVHIRRGDYVSHPEFSKTFGFLGLEYYVKAIKLIKETVYNCRFYIFTDDKPWVLDNLHDDGSFVYVNNTGPDADLDDLHLMKLCRHNIIANSSFSWWGAWLNKHADKIVVAPERWFKNQPNWDTKDLIPYTWLKI